jgi:hypothetical protein
MGTPYCGLASCCGIHRLQVVITQPGSGGHAGRGGRVCGIRTEVSRVAPELGFLCRHMVRAMSLLRSMPLTGCTSLYRRSAHHKVTATHKLPLTVCISTRCSAAIATHFLTDPRVNLGQSRYTLPCHCPHAVVKKFEAPGFGFRSLTGQPRAGGGVETRGLSFVSSVCDPVLGYGPWASG